MKREHFNISWLGVLILSLVLAAPALGQERRSLSISSLRLSSGEPSWLGRDNGLDGVTPTLNLSSGLLDGEAPYLPGGDYDFLTPGGSSALGGLEEFGSKLSIDHRVGRVFNLSVALSSIRQPDLSTGAGRRSMAVSSTQPRSREKSGAGELWSLDVGLEWLSSSGHGVHLGYLYGADPLTGEAEVDLAEQQSVALGYTYDLDWLYVNLGYVYSFGSVWTQRSADSGADSALYLRFQLRF